MTYPTYTNPETFYLYYRNNSPKNISLTIDPVVPRKASHFITPQTWGKCTYLLTYCTRPLRTIDEPIFINFQFNCFNLSSVACTYLGIIFNFMCPTLKLVQFSFWHKNLRQEVFFHKILWNVVIALPWKSNLIGPLTTVPW